MSHFAAICSKLWLIQLSEMQCYDGK